MRLASLLASHNAGRSPLGAPPFRFCSLFFFSSRRRHTRCLSDWSSDVCSSDLRRYGVFDSERGIATRGTFIIDKNGVVRWKVVNPIPQARDLTEYSKALAALG